MHENIKPTVTVRNGTVSIGKFLEIPGSDAITPVDPDRDVNGEPYSFVEAQVSVTYARLLLAELIEKLEEHDLRHGIWGGDVLLPSQVQRPAGPGPVDPVDQELGKFR